MEERRPHSEELLETIQREQEESLTGKLKIFFGYAAGVGKTYAMLEAAHEAQKNGKDVVVGYVERHTRPDTLALINGLEEIPNKEISYHGMTLKEMDLDAILERKPELVLVDEFAHSNAAGCRHLKRYQDVEELLRAGIDVYSTVNVQHLESLHDLVVSITGVSVKERIPDDVFDSAAQVEVVDIEPDDLILRLHEGKVYKENQAKRALTHFFTKENLAALREIALRRTADRLNRTAKKEKKESAARAGEHILICLSPAPSNKKVIRTAARMAEVFHSGFTALYVETSKKAEISEENGKRLKENIRLAEQLGAQIATVYGEEPAVQIAEYAKVSGVTKIVMGRTNHRQSTLFGKKNMVDRLTELAANIDIYIIPDQQPLFRKKMFFPIEDTVITTKDLFKTFLILVCASVIGMIFFQFGMREANIIMIYILGVLLSSIVTRGYLCGVISSICSVVIFNYLFTEPRFSLSADPDYPITFFIMLLTSVLSSTLATRVQRQARQASQKAYYTELLISSIQKLQKGKNEEEILQKGAEQLEALLNRPILYAVSYQDKELSFSVEPKDKEKAMFDRFTLEEKAVAQWVQKNNKHAGTTTNTLSNVKNYYLSVRGMQEVMGIVGIPITSYELLDTFEKNLIIALLNECGIIMERRRLSQEKYNIEMRTRQEKLRSNLLRSISHDLRTPLTGISGNAAILMDQETLVPEEKKQELYTSIYDDAMWLMNLTENLLSITRVENGSMKLKLEPQLLTEVFDEALRHVDRQVKDHVVHTEVKDEFLMAKMDVHLMIQVIINIVNNAIKYMPVGSEINLSAYRKGDWVYIEIADNGQGMDDESKKHLFDMFYTAYQGKGDNRRGLGLGLNLCKSIVIAHGGKISVSDNRPHGAVFTFTLPWEKMDIRSSDC